jgi:hypothetical protein
MVRRRTIALALGLAACRAAAPAVAVRAPDPAPPVALVAPVPAPAPAGPEPSLAAGRGFACELRRDATVWCWGDNHHGQLGDGAREGRAELAAACFGFLPTRAKLDLSGWPETDIFSHE